MNIEAISNAMSGSKFLAEAILAANNALYETDKELVRKLRAELIHNLEWAKEHFEAQFDELLK